MELDEVHKRRFEDLDALWDIRATGVVWGMMALTAAFVRIGW